MGGAGFLEKLLDGETVEWKMLGEIAQCYSGATPKTGIKEYWENGTIPWMNSGEVNKGTVYYTDKKITRSGYDSCSTKMIPANAVVVALAGQGKTRGTVARTRIELCTNQSLCSIVSNGKADSDFIFYYLQTQYQKLRDISSGEGTRGGLNLQMIKSYEIPLPPIAIQSRIVQILDLFSELTKELTKELTIRQQQYQYYRDLLLTFDVHDKASKQAIIQWMTLGEVAKYEQPTKYLVKSTNYHDSFSTPVLTAGKTFVLGYTDESDGVYKASTRPTIIFDDFTTANKWVDFDFKAKSSAMKMINSRDEASFLLKYIYYWMNTLPSGLIESDHKRQWISNFSHKKIPIPPMKTQKNIVAILDQFDTLTTSLTEGLPREIALRQQQYEHYRDLLLNFPRA